MAVSVTNYTGNAGLGSGSNPQIPVGGGGDLDTLTRIGDQIMYQNMAQNKYLYDQKVRERDELLSQISSGQIKVGDLLEDDTSYVKEGLDGLDKAWEEMIKKGKNDLGAQSTYKKALREAQDRVTQAQGRKLFYDKESTEASKETLPRKQAARKQNLDSVVKGGFWKDLTPYQQTQDLDIQGSILNTAKRIETPFTDPKTLTKGTRSMFDYGKTKDANQDNFLNDVNKRYDQEQLIKSIQSLPPTDFAESITAMNNRIKEYNALKGLQPGTEGYVPAIEVEINPQTGQGVIKETLPDFAAKYTLSREKPFSGGTSEFDKERAAFQLGQERNRIAASNAGANQLRARAYSNLQKKKLSQLDDDEKRVKGFWDGVVDRFGEVKTTQGEKDFILKGNLPEGYTFMAGVDAKGQPIQLKPKVTKRKNGTKFEYYETKYNNGANGEAIDKNFLKSKYDTFKSSGGKGTYDAYVRQLIKEGIVDLEIVGENGTADFDTALQSARALSNKVGSGKEEPVYSETELTIEE